MGRYESVYGTSLRGIFLAKWSPNILGVGNRERQGVRGHKEGRTKGRQSFQYFTSHRRALVRLGPRNEHLNYGVRDQKLTGKRRDHCNAERQTNEG